VPTADLKAAIDEIGALLQKYRSVLRATVPPTLTQFTRTTGVHRFAWRGYRTVRPQTEALPRGNSGNARGSLAFGTDVRR
jgi:hypothetical protein